MTLLAKLSQHSALLPPALHAQAVAFCQQLSKLPEECLSLNQSDQFTASILKVCLSSRFIAENWLRHPHLMQDLLHSGDLFNDQRSVDYANAINAQAPDSDLELAKILRHFRRREMIRIAWRDIAGWASLDETLNDLSLLAETCIQTALAFYYQQACNRWGVPTLANGRPFNLVVLGMGKLGAWELNFSSDIDLIIAYAEDGVLTEKKEISYSEFFTRITRNLVRVLDEITVDGFVFRTDLRLRPFGDSGPLVMSFDGMEHYYLTQAREWERYAMIKARQVAGDQQSGKQLAAMIKQFVYRRYLDYGAFEELRSLKMQIMQELKRKDRLDNVKLGPGGIREIEFIGQAFQLIRGGQEHLLQQRELQIVLSLLAELKLLSPQDAASLKAAYRFLRRVENHIQQYQDQQTHDLPKDPQAQLLLAYSLDYDDWISFKQQLDSVRQQVHGVFDGVFSLSRIDSCQQQAQWLWLSNAADDQAQEILADWGYNDTDWISRAMIEFKNCYAVKHLSAKGLVTMQRLLLQLFKGVREVENPEQSCARILKLFESVAGRSVYLALLAENPDALTQLIKLTSASVWISEYLSLYPMLFDVLLDVRSLYEPLQKQALHQELANELAKVEGQDNEQTLIALRRFKHTNLLRVAAADIMGFIPVMVVSDYLTWIAEATLDHTLDLAWRSVGAKHGYPPLCNEQPAYFGIIGYGKLGGLELGYASDLDLVFLHNHPDENANTDGAQPIPSSLFFQRLAQKIRHILDTKLLSGVLYETDLRLRPNGDSGVLTPSIHAYAEYLQHQAWTWERQALVRARFITGDSRLAEQFKQYRQQILMQARDYAVLKTEVRDMRYKMRENKIKPGATRFNLKHSAGGIADIEFLVQFGVLAHAAENPALCVYSDNVRLLEQLAKHGFISLQQAELLKQAFCQYRDYGHHQILQGLSAEADVDAFLKERHIVIQIWHHYLD